MWFSSQLAAALAKRLLLSHSFPWLWIAASRKSAAAVSQQHQPKDTDHDCIKNPVLECVPEFVLEFVLEFADGWPEGAKLQPSKYPCKKRKDCTFRHQIDEKPSIVPGCLDESLQCRLCTESPSICARDPTKHHSQANDRRRPRPSSGCEKIFWLQADSVRRLLCLCLLRRAQAGYRACIPTPACHAERLRRLHLVCQLSPQTSIDVSYAGQAPGQTDAQPDRQTNRTLKYQQQNPLLPGY